MNMLFEIINWNSISLLFNHVLQNAGLLGTKKLNTPFLSWKPSFVSGNSISVSNIYFIAISISVVSEISLFIDASVINVKTAVHNEL